MPTTKFIYYPITNEGKLGEEVKGLRIYRALDTIKQRMIRKGKTKLGVPETEGIAGVIFERMMRFLFIHTGIEVYIYKGKDAGKSSAEQANIEKRYRKKKAEKKRGKRTQKSERRDADSKNTNMRTC